ncbi:50.8 kDa Serine/threonine protein kinase [Spodoptera frugiperda ascovirus 1a]|nr:50.8 kDa Serine/threonine protein kinase [Spodoptera frugiperda ascovirus 1a]CAL44704.1 50.8 kDa Serine/threonine protein kinase [Spodoptera frugiperda ascovirus 1a]
MSCTSVASIKRKAYWCCEFPYATKKTRIVYDKIAKDSTMNASSEIKKIRPKHVDVGYQKLYTDLKFYKRTLQFQASLVCDSAQGRCGFMRRHPTEAADSAYNSASAGSRNSADVYPNARDVVTKTNGERAFFKFSVKTDTHTLGFYEWLVAKSMMLRCSYIPNFMRPYTYTKNTLVINHFVDSDDDPNDDSSTEDNGDGAYVDSVSCPIRKKRIRKRRIEVRRDDNDYLLTDVNPFEVDTDTSKAIDKDITVTDVGVFEVVEGVSLRSSKLSTHQLSSVTYQLCMALLMAQAANGFVHNDLHWKNVILTECDPTLHLTYIYRCTGNGRRIMKRTIPTHGYIPVIIDFGFAFCNELAHESHNPEVLYADHIGYVTYETDNVVDIMRTLLEYSSVCRLPDELMCRIKYCVKHNGRIKVGENSGWYNFETKLTRLLQEAGYVNHRR